VAPQDHEAAPQRLRVVITFLEMKAKVLRPPPRPHKLGHDATLAILRVPGISVGFYRYLYDAVGRVWRWHERRKFSDEKLGAILADPKVDVLVLYVNGEPGGYAELDRRVANEVELAYFGVTPAFIGKGVATLLLRAALDSAWRDNPGRVWVHTCNLDHPRALGFYQRAGFAPYKQVTKSVADPGPELGLPPIPISS
jgi:GNAT superfamily N-acetyltransferase